MRKIITLTCNFCQKEFDRELREHKRQTKKGKDKFYCNLSCTMSQNVKDNPRPGNPQYLIPGNRRDHLTPFKYYVNRGNYRSKNTKRYDCTITTEYLKKLWDEQDGICPLTGWKLILPKDTAYPWPCKSPNNASLDRIDNSLGYIEGNVRFIAFIANMARNEFTDEQVKEFCKAVVQKDDL